MIGFRVAGKVSCVCEDLRQFAEKHKGKSVSECVRLRRLEEAEAKQFGMPVDEYRKIMNVMREG